MKKKEYKKFQMVKRKDCHYIHKYGTALLRSSGGNTFQHITTKAHIFMLLNRIDKPQCEYKNSIFHAILSKER